MKSSQVWPLAAVPVAAVVLSVSFAPMMGEAGHVTFAKSAALAPGCEDGCSLQMMTPSFGWLFNHSALWLTADGGARWESRRLPQMRPGDSAYLGFLNRSEGWLFTASQHLFLTSDGASHWVPVQPPALDGVMQTSWASPTGGLAWLGGGVYRPSQQPDAPNYALKRSDSGWAVLHPAVLSRSPQEVWAQHDLPQCSWTLVYLRRLGDGHAVALGDGCAYYSDTTGSIWTAGTMHRANGSSHRYPSEASHPVAYFLSPVTGWLGLDDHTIWETHDGGRNWNLVSSHAPVFDQFQFISEKRGFGVVRRSELYETIDGGATWNLVKTAFLARSLWLLDDRHAWVTSGLEMYVMKWD